MSKLEAAEEATVLRWCKNNNCLFIKFTPLGDKGWPDRIAVLPNGKTVWIEMKRRGKKPRELQHYRIAQLVEHGALATWFDNAEDTINYLERLL
jgi:hypothetical protein